MVSSSRARLLIAGACVVGALVAVAPQASASAPGEGAVTLPAPPGAAAVPTGVVTLGDSYSSGLGSGDYINDCDNTPNAWGNLIFGSAVTDRTMLACSGATTATIGGQVDALAATSGAGRVVTVTIGGNDVGFASELQECFLSNCTSREATVLAKIDALVDPLADLYSEIQAAAPNDDVIAGGYPLLVPDPDVRTGCTALTFLMTNAERDMIRRLGVALNDAIDAAAAQAGIPAVTTDLENRFVGHEACRNSSTDWIYGLRVSFWSSDEDAAIASMQADPDVEQIYADPQAEIIGGWIRDSFHPTRPGQAAYAAAFEAAYNG